MNGHPALLHSHYAQEFVYYGFFRNYVRMKPFILAMMDSDVESVGQRGAELACIAFISPNALESDEARADAQTLADQAVLGPAPWRRGAARVYARNLVGGPQQLCEQELSRLLGDEDETVRRMAASAIRTLRAEHICSLQAFLERFATSRAMYANPREFAEYLLEHGLLDPPWTLSIIETFLDNPPTEEVPWFSGGEELIRTVVRIYNDPTTDNVVRTRAMDVFDRLMERFGGQAYLVLDEWDRR